MSSRFLALMLYTDVKDPTYAWWPAEAEMKLLSLLITLTCEQANETPRYLRARRTSWRRAAFAHKHQLNHSAPAQEQKDQRPTTSALNWTKGKGVDNLDDVESSDVVNDAD